MSTRTQKTENIRRERDSVYDFWTYGANGDMPYTSHHDVPDEQLHIELHSSRNLSKDDPELLNEIIDNTIELKKDLNQFMSKHQFNYKTLPIYLHLSLFDNSKTSGGAGFRYKDGILHVYADLHWNLYPSPETLGQFRHEILHAFDYAAFGTSKSAAVQEGLAEHFQYLHELCPWHKIDYLTQPAPALTTMLASSRMDNPDKGELRYHWTFWFIRYLLEQGTRQDLQALLTNIYTSQFTQKHQLPFENWLKQKAAICFYTPSTTTLTIATSKPTTTTPQTKTTSTTTTKPATIISTTITFPSPTASSSLPRAISFTQTITPNTTSSSTSQTLKINTTYIPTINDNHTSSSSHTASTTALSTRVWYTPSLLQRLMISAGISSAQGFTQALFDTVTQCYPDWSPRKKRYWVIRLGRILTCAGLNSLHVFAMPIPARLLASTPEAQEQRLLSAGVYFCSTLMLQSCIELLSAGINYCKQPAFKKLNTILHTLFIIYPLIFIVFNGQEQPNELRDSLITTLTAAACSSITYFSTQLFFNQRRRRITRRELDELPHYIEKYGDPSVKQPLI